MHKKTLGEEKNLEIEVWAISPFCLHFGNPRRISKSLSREKNLKNQEREIGRTRGRDRKEQRSQERI
jgi:hypothetical protein